MKRSELSVIALAVPVGAATVEELLAAHEVHRDPGPRGKRPHLTGKKIDALLDLEPVGPFRRRGVLVLQHRAVAGEKDRHFMPAIRQRTGQRPHRVRETTGLHVGEEFARDVDDFHRSYRTAGVS